MLRRLTLGLLAATILVGCGSSSSSSSNPTTAALSYYPQGSPLVLTVATDPGSNAMKGANDLIAHFPTASLGIAALKTRLQQAGINYDADLRPLFGNPIALGAAGTTLTGSASKQYLVVWVTKDSGALGSLVKKLGVKQLGTHDGAKIYQAGGSTTLAVDGATALLGASAADVNQALDRHANKTGITSSQYSTAFTGLPQDALVSVFGNLNATLSNSSAAKARQVPWVAAFHGYAATVTAGAGGLTFQYRLDTGGSSLSSSQLPFAAGNSPPGLAGSAPITVGIHDPSQIVAFAENAAQITSPTGWADFQKRQAAVRAKTGTDLNALFKLLTGDLIIGSDTHTTIARVQVSDGAQATSILAKLASAPRNVFNKTASVTKLSGGFYAVREGSTTLTVGVVGNQLVLGSHATLAQIRTYAALPTAPLSGAQGTVAFRLSLAELIRLASKSAIPSTYQSLLSMLGDISGWSAASPSALNGSASLAIK